MTTKTKCHIVEFVLWQAIALIVAIKFGMFAWLAFVAGSIWGYVERTAYYNLSEE